MTVTRVITESGSVYELDQENKLCRRAGKPGVTRRATPSWKQYSNVVDMEVGKQMIVFWPTDNTTLLDETVEKMKAGEIPAWMVQTILPATITSPVVSVEQIEAHSSTG